MAPFFRLHLIPEKILYSPPDVPPAPPGFASLTSFCRSIFSVRSNTLSLSLSCLVPLTYFMAHCQRRRECLLLSVVSRSVGQRRRMRASFPPAFVSCPSSPPASLLTSQPPTHLPLPPSLPGEPHENYSRSELGGGSPYIFPHLLVVVSRVFSFFLVSLVSHHSKSILRSHVEILGRFTS